MTSAGTIFVVDLEGFEGPLDLLLTLARNQKVDLARISVLALVDQYLAYLAHARALRLEIAAEYLVMAAWLVYLKSRLLLPPPAPPEPDADELARILAERLRRLDAIRRAAVVLQERARLGEARHARGQPEPFALIRTGPFALGLHELLGAYADVMCRSEVVTLTVERPPVLTVEQALERLSRLLTGQEWQDLARFVPDELADGTRRRSMIASGLVASLELARQGRIELRQTRPFGPVMVRRA